MNDYECKPQVSFLFVQCLKTSKKRYLFKEEFTDVKHRRGRQAKIKYDL